MEAPFVMMRDISKNFGGVEALRNVNFEVYNNEIVALLGDNGAGKSTLIKILSGAVRMDAGEIIINGKKANIKNPHNAKEEGIQTVYQNLALADSIDSIKNIFLGNEIIKRILGLPVLNNRTMIREAKRIIEKIGIRIDSLKENVENLSGGQRQAIAISRALVLPINILILDEPTAAMGVRESKIILDVINNLKKVKKIGIVIISHNIDHVLKVADRAVVLKNGQRVGDMEISNSTHDDIAKLIITGKLNTNREKGI